MEQLIISILSRLSFTGIIGVAIYYIVGFVVPESIFERINRAGHDAEEVNRRGRRLTLVLSLLIGMLMVELYHSGLKPFHENYAMKRKIEKRVEKLTTGEADVLRPFIEEKTLSQIIQNRNRTGAVDALERDGVLYLIREDKIIHVWYYNIERVAYFYLLKHPEMLSP